MTVTKRTSELKSPPDNEMFWNDLFFSLTLRSVFFLYYSAGCPSSPVNQSNVSPISFFF